ncbi:proteasome regulator gamma [Dermatophagoides pteronyssinus]|uniref:Proteasome activator complex subunit 3-like n=1 Tax=Dermatophagoides pteronyssinus TaxID=6956 RepID=A0A6P6Y566_DERPT|nr:proteasome activator complex subunit 3-like [Dermatophagoides pteronyssinus]
MSSSSSSSIETDYTTEINKFKDDIKARAEELVLKTFPRKTIELHRLLESQRFSLKNLEKIKHEINIPIPEYPYVTPVQSTPVTVDSNHHHHHHVDDSENSSATDCDSSPTSQQQQQQQQTNGPSSKKRKYLVLTEDDNRIENDQKSSSTTSENLKNQPKPTDGSRVLILPYGSVRCNKHIVELIDIVKPLIRQLVEDTNLLKMWVLFLIPRIEDGNNFGVSIQEEALTEIRTVEAEATTYFDQMSHYFHSRARIITKIAKYPHVDDFRRNVAEIDEKEFLCLRLTMVELRNHYASLHDIVTKNLDKIKTPRSTNQNHQFY